MDKWTSILYILTASLVHPGVGSSSPEHPLTNRVFPSETSNQRNENKLPESGYNTKPTCTDGTTSLNRTINLSTSVSIITITYI